MKRSIARKLGRFSFCCCLAVIAGKALVMWDESGSWLWQKQAKFCAEASWTWPRSSRVVIASGSGRLRVSDRLHFVSGAWSLCRSTALCQLKSSSTGRWKRGRPHFIAAAAWRLASDCCRQRLFSTNSFLWRAQSPARSRQEDKRDISSISTARLFDVFKACSVKTWLNRWSTAWDFFAALWNSWLDSDLQRPPAMRTVHDG